MKQIPTNLLFQLLGLEKYMWFGRSFPFSPTSPSLTLGGFL